MGKRKHSPDWMQARVEEYLIEKRSLNSIAKKNGIGRTALRRWVAVYKEQGIAAFCVTKMLDHYKCYQG